MGGCCFLVGVVGWGYCVGGCDWLAVAGACRVADQF